MSSVWLESVKRTPKSKLQGDIQTDVAIIGGGMAGILTAYLLRCQGVDCVLLEANKIGGGVTQNTTAKITSQHNLIYDKLIRTGGQEKAMQYLRANELALKKFRELCQKVDCDFHTRSAFVFSTTDERKIIAEVEALASLGFEAKFTKQIELPFAIAGGIEFPNQAEFNPLKFLHALAQELTIYEDTRVKSIENNVLHTDYGTVRANKVVVTTHYPFINVPGYFFLKMYQQRSYVIALKNAQDINGMYIDENEKGCSFRGYGELLLMGGGGHRTGKQGGSYQALRHMAKSLYSNSTEAYAWATQDCMTLDLMPYIGTYSKSTPNLFVATGFNKWGMTSSMVSAMLLSNLILSQKNEYEELFSPQRFSPNKQFFINGFETTANMLKLKPRRCSHLGCALNYNQQEHTWDCPCHGSRFEADGALIDNPATKNGKFL